MKVLIHNLVNMRLKTLAFIVFTVVFGSLPLNAFAQNVTFSDANLAAAVRSALNLAEGADIPLSSEPSSVAAGDERTQASRFGRLCAEVVLTRRDVSRHGGESQWSARVR